MGGPSGRTGRGLVVAAGALLALAGLAAVGAHVAQQADGGWFASSTERFSTPTSVLVTDEILVEEGRPGDPPTDLGELAEVRIRATPAEPGQPVFVGIGPKADVDAYLRGTAHDRMASFDLEPFAVRFDRVPGGPAPAPAAQPFWVATASGPGTQTLLWDKTRGAWSAVVMNADGSPGVDVRADVGLRFGFLLPLGVALLAAAALVAAGPSVLRRVRSANASRRE
ncbi:hypothetical protein [Pseudonocardia cypriaca]|uniref:Uncharacterized protein n=1 Tax=Pseudonocardia cypriaca TaxID=882449 RepID=A0A543GIP0_9PSEU|nr:hypothetical protein [Pseudonocardia cypriaca]TQM45951.1 hypothetical protein FB388_3352 [Pseudonocardia cypriaca]